MPRFRPGAQPAGKMTTREWSRWCDQRPIWDSYEVTTTPFTAGKEELILVDDDTAGATTVNLPAISGNTGISYTIKKMGSTANVTVDANGSETIDGLTTQTLSTQYESITVVCTANEWVTI